MILLKIWLVLVLKLGRRTLEQKQVLMDTKQTEKAAVVSNLVCHTRSIGTLFCFSISPLQIYEL